MLPDVIWYVNSVFLSSWWPWWWTSKTWFNNLCRIFKVPILFDLKRWNFEWSAFLMCFCNSSLCGSTPQYRRTCLVFSSGNGVVQKRCGYILFRKTFLCSLEINEYIIIYALVYIYIYLVFVPLLHSLSLSHSLTHSFLLSLSHYLSYYLLSLSPHSLHPNTSTLQYLHNNVTCVLTRVNIVTYELPNYSRDGNCC
jgi:hypothetical protein